MKIKAFFITSVDSLSQITIFQEMVIRVLCIKFVSLIALTLKYWISHHFDLSPARGTCEMPSSAQVGQVFFPGIFGFRLSLINDRLDISKIFLKRRNT